MHLMCEIPQTKTDETSTFRVTAVIQKDASINLINFMIRAPTQEFVWAVLWKILGLLQSLCTHPPSRHVGYLSTAFHVCS